MKYGAQPSRVWSARGLRLKWMESSGRGYYLVESVGVTGSERRLNRMGLKLPTNLTSISHTLVLILPTIFLIRARTVYVDICYACIVNHRFLKTILLQMMYPN